MCIVFTMFCIVCTVFLYCLVYVYLVLFVLSVLVQGLLPPSDNPIAVSNNNNNNNNNSNNNKGHYLLKCNTVQSGTQLPTGLKNFLLPSTS